MCDGMWSAWAADGAIFEYARAAGYHTAYWTSQHLMFGNARLYVQDLPLDRFACATTLDPKAWMIMCAAPG